MASRRAHKGEQGACSATHSCGSSASDCSTASAAQADMMDTSMADDKQQQAGKKTARGGGRRRFVGVRQRPSGRWVAEIKDSNQRIRLWLGTFDNAEDAARAYDDAARALRGAHTRTNFALADSPGPLLMPSKAAARILLQRVQSAASSANNLPALAQQPSYNLGASRNMLPEVVPASTNSDLSAARSSDSEDDSCTTATTTTNYKNRELLLSSPQSVLLLDHHAPARLTGMGSNGGYGGGGGGLAPANINASPRRSSGEANIYGALREKLSRALKGSARAAACVDAPPPPPPAPPASNSPPGMYDAPDASSYSYVYGRAESSPGPSFSDNAPVSYATGFQPPLSSTLLTSGNASDMCGVSSATSAADSHAHVLRNAAVAAMAASNPLLLHHLHHPVDHPPATHTARIGTSMHGCTTSNQFHSFDSGMMQQQQCYGASVSSSRLLPSSAFITPACSRTTTPAGVLAAGTNTTTTTPSSHVSISPSFNASLFTIAPQAVPAHARQQEQHQHQEQQQQQKQEHSHMDPAATAPFEVFAACNAHDIPESVAGSAFASPSWNIPYSTPKLIYSSAGDLGEAAQDAFWSSLWSDQSPQVCAAVA